MEKIKSLLNCLKNIILKIIHNSCLIIFLLLWMTAFSLAQDNPSDSLKINAKKIQKDSVRQVSKKSSKRAMIYSAVVPGLGQWYNGKKLKAIVIFGTEIGLLINSIDLNQKYQVEKARLTTDPLYDKRAIDFYLNNRNLSTWWLVGVTLFSVLDANVDAQLFDFDESPTLSFKCQPKFGLENTWAVSCSFTW
jgi:hypothetical protein